MGRRRSPRVRRASEAQANAHPPAQRSPAPLPIPAHLNADLTEKAIEELVPKRTIEFAPSPSAKTAPLLLLPPAAALAPAPEEAAAVGVRRRLQGTLTMNVRRADEFAYQVSSPASKIGLPACLPACLPAT